MNPSGVARRTLGIVSLSLFVLGCQAPQPSPTASTAPAPATPSTSASPVITGEGTCPLIDPARLAAAVGLQVGTLFLTEPTAMPASGTDVQGGAALGCQPSDPNDPDFGLLAYSPAWECVAGACHDFDTLEEFEARIAGAATTEPISGLGQSAYWVTGEGFADGNVEAFGGGTTYPVVGVSASGLSMAPSAWKSIGIELAREMLALP